MISSSLKFIIYLDVLLEDRINGEDQWLISAAYKWGYFGLQSPTDPNH